MIGLIGIILPMGIVKKNAIMMIDFALEAERHQGMTAYDAIVQACLLRFRPIMMTTLAALFGAVAVGHRKRNRSRAPFPAGRFDHWRPYRLSQISRFTRRRLFILRSTGSIAGLRPPFRQISDSPSPPIAGATEGVQ